jgi:hypothetical protein
MKSLENQQNKIMKTKATLIALLAGAVISGTAHASLINTLIPSTEVGVVNSGLGPSTPVNFDISSEASDTGTTFGGLEVYQYQYNIPDRSSDPLLLADVRLILSEAGLTGAGNYTTTTSSEISWGAPPLGAPGAAVTLWFNSTTLPIIGQLDVQDNGQWQDQDVVIPNAEPSVPDGGLTMALLGGSLMGLQALRRKLAR